MVTLIDGETILNEEVGVGVGVARIITVLWSGGTVATGSGEVGVPVICTGCLGVGSCVLPNK